MSGALLTDSISFLRVKAGARLLKQRVITALLLAPVVVAAILMLPAAAFSLVALLIFTMAAWEWAGLAGLAGFTRSAYLLAFVVLCVVLFQTGEWIWPVVFLVAIVIWMLALYWVARYPAAKEQWGGRVQRGILGLALLVPAWLAMVYLKQLSSGGVLILMLMLMIWAADIGAYFSGRTWGHKKLAPQVSPGKTWAGVYGGLAAALLTCWVVALLVGLLVPDQPVQWFEFALLALAVAAISILGDLTVSMVKRYRGVKDSGSLLPGHGGLLDRIDSLVAGLPLFSLLFTRIGFS